MYIYRLLWAAINYNTTMPGEIPMPGNIFIRIYTLDILLIATISYSILRYAFLLWEIRIVYSATEWIISRFSPRISNMRRLAIFWTTESTKEISYGELPIRLFTRSIYWFRYRFLITAPSICLWYHQIGCFVSTILACAILFITCKSHLPFIPFKIIVRYMLSYSYFPSIPPFFLSFFPKARNLVTALYSSLCIFGIVVSLLSFLVTSGWQLGVLESICVTLVVGLSIDFGTIYFFVPFFLSFISSKTFHLISFPSLFGYLYHLR